MTSRGYGHVFVIASKQPNTLDNVPLAIEHCSMNRKQLKTILSDLEVTQVDIAGLLDVTTRAVSLWLSGTRSIPGPVAAYVKLFASLPIGMRQAELARITELKTMKNGMYFIEYAGQTGQGHATLLFDDGRVYGADVAGGKYDGAYQYNEATGLVDIQLRVELAANRPSVIGIEQPFDWILEVTTTAEPEQDAGQLQVQTNLGKPIVAQYRFLRSLPVAA